MAAHRPLPRPPSLAQARANHAPPALDPRSMNNPYFVPHYSQPDCPSQIHDEPATSTIPAGTFLHKGFYDLLAMIPTPSPSRLLWPTTTTPEPVVAGPRYEDIRPPPGGAVRASPKRGRRISKDMVSNPKGFVYVCKL
jgi:protein-serine/threonine kinase